MESPDLDLAIPEKLLPSSVQYQDTLHRMTDYFVAQGNSLLQAQQQAVQWIGRQVQAQASFLAYMDAFWVLMLISLAAVPLALTLQKVKLGGPVDGEPAAILSREAPARPRWRASPAPGRRRPAKAGGLRAAPDG
jgi:hypothetical protein